MMPGLLTMTMTMTLLLLAMKAGTRNFVTETVLLVARGCNSGAGSRCKQQESDSRLKTAHNLEEIIASLQRLHKAQTLENAQCSTQAAHRLQEQVEKTARLAAQLLE
jgi:hypothetical protein